MDTQSRIPNRNLDRQFPLTISPTSVAVLSSPCVQTWGRIFLLGLFLSLLLGLQSPQLDSASCGAPIACAENMLAPSETPLEAPVDEASSLIPDVAESGPYEYLCSAKNKLLAWAVEAVLPIAAQAGVPKGKALSELDRPPC